MLIANGLAGMGFAVPAAIAVPIDHTPDVSAIAEELGAETAMI